MKKITLMALLVSGVAFAAPITFPVGTGTAREAQLQALVSSETDVEDFTGRTNKVSGQIIFDPVAKTGSGTIMVDGASISTGIALRDEHMRSSAWLNFDKNPEIKFQTTRVSHQKDDTYSIQGSFTLNGVTKNITTAATVKHLPEGDATKKAAIKGDGLSLKTSFSIKLSDYGVKIPAGASDKVNDTVNVVLSVITGSGSK